MQLPKTSFAMVQTAKRELTPMDIDIPDIDDESLRVIAECPTASPDHSLKVEAGFEMVGDLYNA